MPTLTRVGHDKSGNSVPAVGGTPLRMAVHLKAGQHLTYGQGGIGEYILPRGTAFRVNSMSGGQADITVTSPQPAAALAGTVTAQFLDLGWRDQPRNSRGEWTRFGGVGSAVRVMEREREGFSVSPRTGESPPGGYMVALDGHTHRYPAEILDHPRKLQRAIDDMLMSERDAFRGRDMYLGGWVEDGKLWLDPSQNVQDRAEAVRLGRERDQVGIFDLNAFETIPTGGSGGGGITDHAELASPGGEGARAGAGRLLGPAGGAEAGGGREARQRDQDRAEPRAVSLAGGWRGTWEHELRGRDGKWAREAEEAAQPAVLGIGRGSSGVPEETRKAIGEFMNAADGHVPQMFGHGRHVYLDWDHQPPTVYPDRERKGYLAFIDWNGHMNLSATTARGLDQALNGPGPVADPDAVLVPLHELIHAIIPQHQSRLANGDMQAFQKPAAQAIDEGFTQLGATNHAAEFFTRIGIGERPTRLTGDDGQNLTMAGYARRMADPDAVRSGSSWGNYAEWTADALNWTEEVSRRTGGKRTPQQLADQVSSVGTAAKPRVMAEQLLSASGIKGLSPAETRQALASAEEQIMASWGRNAAAQVAEQASVRMRGTVAAMRETKAAA